MEQPSNTMEEKVGRLFWINITGSQLLLSFLAVAALAPSFSLVGRNAHLRRGYNTTPPRSTKGEYEYYKRANVCVAV